MYCIDEILLRKRIRSIEEARFESKSPEENKKCYWKTTNSRKKEQRE
jgi:hypothetical protein